MQYLAWDRSVFAWRQNVGAATFEQVNKAGAKKKYFVQFGHPGIADIIGIYKGRFLAIEAKVGKNDQSPAQREFERSVKAAGGIYILAYSLDDVMKGMGGTI